MDCKNPLHNKISVLCPSCPHREEQCLEWRIEKECPIHKEISKQINKENGTESNS